MADVYKTSQAVTMQGCRVRMLTLQLFSGILEHLRQTITKESAHGAVVFKPYHRTTRKLSSKSGERSTRNEQHVISWMMTECVKRWRTFSSALRLLSGADETGCRLQRRTRFARRRTISTLRSLAWAGVFRGIEVGKTRIEHTIVGALLWPHCLQDFFPKIWEKQS